MPAAVTPPPAVPPGQSVHSDQSPPPLAFCVGIDWAATSHEACIVGIDGRRRGQRAFAHDPQGLHELVTWVAEKTQVEPERVGFAIETPHHPIVDLTLDRGYRVFSLNPKQADRFRDRHTAAGSKDDRKDAYVHGDALRTDQAKFRELAPPAAELVRLRELSRRCDTLQGDKNRLTSRLWEALTGYAPQLLKLCEGVLIQPFFWDLLALGLDPKQARTLRLTRVAKVINDHRKRNVTPEQCLAALRGPRLCLLPGREAAALATIASLLPQLQVVERQLQTAKKELEPLVRGQGETAKILLSFKGIGFEVAAAFLAEANHVLGAGNLQALRGLCGTAPVTRQSGKSRQVGMRRACNHYLRNACRSWAWTAVRDDPWATSLYEAMRARGLGHNRALRGIADRLLTRLAACLRDGTTYDPSKSSPPGSASPSETL